MREMSRFRGLVLVRVLFLLLLAAACLGGFYYVWILQPAQANQDSNEQRAARMVGLSDNPVAHHLSPEYTDADGDLVADVPKDVTKRIDPDTLVFSWIAEDQNEGMRDAFKDLTTQLAKATGKKVEYDPDMTSTQDQLKALKEGKLHITVFSTGAVPIAVNIAGFVPVGMLASESGNAKHQMLIIVPAASTIMTAADLRGHELALTEPNSNSGYKAAIVLLKNDIGLIFEHDYRVLATQSYENSIAGIAKGQYDAAAVASDVLERAVANGAIKKSDYRVIYTSPDFPSAAIGYAYNLKPELAATIKDTLLSFDFKGTSLEARFASSNESHFVPLNYFNDWAIVRMIDDTISGPQEIR
jgi:phosphonate transport system substrate-binding protein